MSVKIAAAESFPTPPSLVVVREYNHQRDKVAVKELERRCEAAADEKPSIVTDMGDPISRIRNFSCHLMLVRNFNDHLITMFHCMHKLHACSCMKMIVNNINR